MALEPTSVQRDKMLSRGKNKLILAQFLAAKDAGSALEYLRETSRAVVGEGGTREHQLRIDQLITNGEMPYQYLTVDKFPSSLALLLAHENSREIRQASLTETYALIIQPNPAVKKIIGGLSFLASALTSFLKTSEIKDLNQIENQSDRLDPQTEPDLSKILEFSSAKLDEPFYMMNLNQYSPSPRRGEGGKSAYNQYSARIIPRLISVGGYPDIYGKILGTYIGDPNGALSNSWHDFVLVYYPSRTSFLRLLTNTPRGAAEIRREGLKKVVLMPCIKI